MSGATGDNLDCLVRPSITSDQRRDFRRWSESLNNLDDATKGEEGEAWIAAAMAILDRSNDQVEFQEGSEAE